LDEIGYSGWVGCEYRPAGDTVAGLGWFRPWMGTEIKKANQARNVLSK
jgi:hydroxypyruvate isomerase